jgi:hypothetical protein
MTHNLSPITSISLLAFCAVAFAQNITVSKDSLQVYNNPMLSSADGVTFTSHTSTAVTLDSAFITVAQMDTAGLTAVLAAKSLEAVWTAYTPTAANYQWLMDSVSPNNYKLSLNYPTGSSGPLSFSGNDTTSQIFRFQIGSCFYCDRLPEYPKYFKGTLRLFFSNGQVVELKLWSQNLSTGVKTKSFSRPASTVNCQRMLRIYPFFLAVNRQLSTVNHDLSTTVNFFSINGQNITTAVMKGNYFERNGIVIVKITENGRSYYLKQMLTK